MRINMKQKSQKGDNKTKVDGLPEREIYLTVL